MSIFVEQRGLTDDEMQAYKDMLHRKEKAMEIKATESGFNYKIQTEQDVLIEELINKVTSLEEDMEVVRKHIRILDGIIF